MARATVLLIDDEKDLIALVRYNLEKEGWEVVAARDGEEGLALARKLAPEMIVLDVMMPGLDGLEVCRRLRADAKTARIPIIMLTARAAESDRVVGLEIGADDYVTKPFSPRELIARIKAVQRRTSPPAGAREVKKQGDLVIDAERHEVAYKGKPLTLTATEFRILEFLAARPGHVFSRSDIIDGALGRDVAVVDRTVDVHVTAIRKKLGRGGDLIETVRGFGYKFRE